MTTVALFLVFEIVRKTKDALAPSGSNKGSKLILKVILICRAAAVMKNIPLCLQERALGCGLNWDSIGWRNCLVRAAEGKCIGENYEPG